MRVVTLDFETYYDKDFSLSKLQTDAYILDPRFEVIGVGVKDGAEETQWVTEGIDKFLQKLDLSDAAVVCHHAQFDGFILTQRFGIRPKLWLDTLSMARFAMPYFPSHSLSALAKHFGLPEKGGYVVNALGKRKQNFSEVELMEYGEYCKRDVEITAELTNKLLPLIPPLEVKLIDMTVRMFTEPSFVGDVDGLRGLFEGEVKRKEQVLEASGVDKETIMSNHKFAKALRALGVEPPMKTSARTGKLTYAFAKTDKEFEELLNHEDPRVQALVAARLGVKSTIAETRALTFLEMAERPALLGSHIIGSSRTGGLPVYLNYWGAKVTGRFSGGNSVNWQNLPARGPSAGIRNMICAPKGHTVIVADSSNIELRVAMVAAGQWDVVEKISSGVDLYCDFASKLFNRTITKEDKKERQLGKVAMLGCQYGVGPKKFKEIVRLMAGQNITDGEAEEIVGLYRNVHGQIVNLWRHSDDLVLPDIYNGCNMVAVDKNAWCITADEGFGVNGGRGVTYHN